MINRILIRVKVLQIVYSFYQKGSENLNSAENELIRSLQKSYDLYHYLLLLITTLTDAEQKRLDVVKNKYLPTKQELNPDIRLINNRLAEQLRTNDTLRKFANRYGVMWNDEDNGFIRNLLNKILQSDIYSEYLQSPDTYAADHEFWKDVFKNIILEDEALFDMLEEKSIYWDGDLEIVGTYVLKTIRRFGAQTTASQELLPMFKSDEDRQYAIRLLHKTILEYEENEELINRQMKNWDSERIALIDLYIMQIALSEIKNFPSIPVSVTLNEYIDLAKYYSTPKSGIFINGILDSIVSELKAGGILFKD
jgi:N utilization substance protein B